MKCEHCENEIEIGTEQKHTTKQEHVFCSYECMEGYYCDDIPEDEDFIGKD